MTKVLSIVSVMALAIVFGVSTVKAAPPAEKLPVTKGEITKIDGMTITLRAGDVEKSITANDATEVVINGEKKAVADLKAGDKINATMDGETVKKITTGSAPKPGALPVTKGEITKVEGMVITLKAGELEKTITADAATEVIIKGEKKTVADLKAGDKINATMDGEKVKKITTGSAPKVKE